MELNKRAYFFTMDAFIAFLIILGVVIFIKPASINITQQVVLQDDLIKALSDLKIGEIDNSYIKNLISTGEITKLNQSILEQVGEFYANSNPEANLIVESIFSELDLNEGLAIYFSDNLIASTKEINWTEAEKIKTARQVISGVGGGLDGANGFSSRAFLFSENKIKYFYFGGYVGDGNISVDLGENISSVSVEADFGADFDVYVNDIYTESHTPTRGTPYSFNLNNHADKFLEGENTISFKSLDSLYIAGGYVKVSYSSVNAETESHNFPGIEGIVNLYDSFYIPGGLNSMNIFLHYNSPYNIFMKIGDQKIYSGNSGGLDTEVTISNSLISSLIDYTDIEQKTVPIRIGFENISDELGLTVRADVFSVTDISGSMDVGCNGGSFWCCLFSGGCSTESSCSSCGGTFEDKMEAAKDANRRFIESVLNYSGNKVGLVAYESSVNEANTHDLSNNSVSLIAESDSWVSGGSTCICCGINSAVEKILDQSVENNFLSLVIMSDGEANIQCSEQGTGDAKQDAVQAACDAFNDYGIRVYSVGFGTDADQTTLQSISSCGNGNYYFGEISELSGIYEQIAADILRAIFVEQTLVGEGITTKLFPDSKINLDYDLEVPYGLMIMSETEDFGNTISEGSFNVPEDSVAHNVEVISYSGAKWTDLVQVYNNESEIWETVFNLSEYNSNYTELGDPYVVNVPSSKIKTGENKIRVSTSAIYGNSSGGSEYDKIIYSLIKSIAAYSPILPVANGCKWNIEFEDGTSSSMNFPSTYTGSDECYYAEDNYFISGTNILLANPNDAISKAVLNLLEALDLNSNNKIETKFVESDMSLTSVEAEGLPFVWETEVQVRSWQ